MGMQEEETSKDLFNMLSKMIIVALSAIIIFSIFYFMFKRLTAGALS